ncbi:hypothetical protein RclHR1_16700001 [Rhizophagus clarus]|uniref:Uncharacterized protein n=1 Tax=Rhizophagus clarus TaxID=94130 RepID=A0A2Z6QYU4_9GLOM|nr:hypothetical protein RclHR1_16700001 [Rhizophagus clarus]GES73447.1 hypothetical protein GLOIN_2v1839531 [Rhizophagus clarus]
MCTLHEREPYLYMLMRCVRCMKTIEDWNHLWRCKSNNTNITQFINSAWETIAGEWLSLSEDASDTNFHVKILNILNEKSSFLNRAKIFDEAICSFVNKSLYMGYTDNKYKQLIGKFITKFQLEVKEIWKQRCSEVIQWEKCHEITSKIKKEHTTMKVIQKTFYNRNYELSKKAFLQGCIDRWVGSCVKGTSKLEKVWREQKVDDLWTYTLNRDTLFSVD